MFADGSAYLEQSEIVDVQVPRQHTMQLMRGVMSCPPIMLSKCKTMRYVGIVECG